MVTDHPIHIGFGFGYFLLVASAVYYFHGSCSRSSSHQLKENCEKTVAKPIWACGRDMVTAESWIFFVSFLPLLTSRKCYNNVYSPLHPPICSSRGDFLSDPVDLTLDYWIAAAPAADSAGWTNAGSSSERSDRSVPQMSFPGTSTESKKSASSDISKNVKTSIRYLSKVCPKFWRT